MDTKRIDLVSLFERSLKQEPQKQLDEVGIVVQVGDGICKIYGLVNAVYGELVEFEHGNKGIILNLQEDFVSVFILYGSILVSQEETVRRTGQVLKVPVSKNGLFGRVIDALGRPIDGLGEIIQDDCVPVEQNCATIIERSPIDEPLQTGVLTIDSLIPVGKGQRELIIGNRNTGKTALVTDIILNQKGKNVICMYVSIGQRQGNLARLVRLLQEKGAMEYCIIVSADAGETVLNQYLAPYSSTSIAEYFMRQGKDVLIIYDDLSNHAIAYREMSLLMRRAPGREAYPGDVFYLHSRLLERAAKLKAGGSITALPIVQIQGDDITSYIPTNLISITDGQLFLDTQLFNNNIRPAINVELSVSRVGGAAQTKAVKKMTRALRLELAQYNDLLAFAQFGTELDEVSQRQLKRGALVVEILKQKQFQHYSMVDEVLILFLLRYNFLDAVALMDVQECIVKFCSYVGSVYGKVYKTIESEKDLSTDTIDSLRAIAQEFSRIFISENSATR